MLYSQKMWDEFVRTAKVIISADMECLTNQNEVLVVLAALTLKHRVEALHAHRLDASVPSSTIQRDRYTFGISAEELWKLHRKVCTLLFEQKKFVELESWAIAVLMCVHFHRELDKSKVRHPFQVLSSFYICLRRGL